MGHQMRGRHKGRLTWDPPRRLEGIMWPLVDYNGNSTNWELYCCTRGLYWCIFKISYLYVKMDLFVQKPSFMLIMLIMLTPLNWYQKKRTLDYTWKFMPASYASCDTNFSHKMSLKYHHLQPLSARVIISHYLVKSYIHLSLMWKIKGIDTH